MQTNGTGKDEMWRTIRQEVERDAREEPMLASFLHATVLNHETLEDALSYHLASKLSCQTIHAMSIREVIANALADDPWIGEAVRADLQGVRDRDPACRGYSTAFLYFKGFQALQSYRIAHYLWGQGRESLALHLQSSIAQIYTVDIHPAARIGKGILLDHANGMVIGETTVVDDNCSFLHEVTLGGTGKQGGDRHPKIRQGVMVGAGAKILGNIIIGEGAKVAAGSVVLEPVPPHCTVAGVPAKIVGHPHSQNPALEMDQRLEEVEKNVRWGI